LLDEVYAQRNVLIRLAYRFCWNRDDAEDAVQRALVLAAREQHQLADRSKLWSWVQSIIVRQCHSLLRTRARQRKAETNDGANARASSVDVSPTAKLLRREFTELVKRMVASLPDRQQTAIVLRHLAGMSYREIAEMMGVSESTARVQVHNARELLRQAILAEHPEWALDDHRSDA
jgi:RNA polymerase sigma-70 factor (ECF subfamily)